MIETGASSELTHQTASNLLPHAEALESTARDLKLRHARLIAGDLDEAVAVWVAWEAAWNDYLAWAGAMRAAAQAAANGRSTSTAHLQSVHAAREHSHQRALQAQLRLYKRLKLSKSELVGLLTVEPSGPSVRGASPTHSPGRQPIDDDAQAIADACVRATLEANGALLGKLKSRTSAAESDWPLRVELLGFYLHAADRFSFGAGGAPIRDSLMDPSTEYAAGALVRASWRRGETANNPNWNHDEWLARMINETIENLLAANDDYSQCSELIGRSLEPGTALSMLVDRFTTDESGSADLDDVLAAAVAIPRAMLDAKLIEITAAAARHKNDAG